MIITFSNLGASASPDFTNNSGGFSFSTPSWTPPNDGLIILFVANSEINGFNGPPSVSGNNLTWYRRAMVTFNPEFEEDAGRLCMFVADASGSTPGQTTINFGADFQDRCDASFFHVDHADLSLGASNAFVQVVTSAGAGTSGQLSMSAASNSNNLPIAAFAHAADEGATPRINWTEMDDLHSATGGLETQVRSDAFETTASASWSSNVYWGGIAAEIKAVKPNMAAILYYLRQQGIG